MEYVYMSMQMVIHHELNINYSLQGTILGVVMRTPLAINIAKLFPQYIIMFPDTILRFHNICG